MPVSRLLQRPECGIHGKMMEKPCQLISIFRYPLGCSFCRCAVNEHMIVFHFLDEIQFTFFNKFCKICLFPVAPLYARFFCLGKKAVDTGIGILDIVNRVVAGLLFARSISKSIWLSSVRLQKKYLAASLPTSSISSRSVTACPVRLDIFTGCPSRRSVTIWRSMISKSSGL